jgi:hypothetical protein
VPGQQAVDAGGSKISMVYSDEQSGQPMGVTVSTGMFGTRRSFVPIHGARFEDDQVVLAVVKDQVKGAPTIDNDAHISEREGRPIPALQRLVRHCRQVRAARR